MILNHERLFKMCDKKCLMALSNVILSIKSLIQEVNNSKFVSLFILAGIVILITFVFIVISVPVVLTMIPVESFERIEKVADLIKSLIDSNNPNEKLVLKESEKDLE